MAREVDTDALRDFANELEQDERTDWGVGTRQMRAAADEVDRLRLSNATMQSAIQEIERRSEKRLEAITTAPHGEDCQGHWVLGFPNTGYTGCTCWKEGVL